MTPLTFEGIVVTPTAGVLYRPEPFEFKGGPLWPDFDNQLEARQCRDRVPRAMDTRPDPPPAVDAFLPEAAWCGPVCSHFGHAIADFGMRIATSAHRLPGLPLLFSVEAGAEPTVPSFFWGIIDQFAVPRERVRFVGEPIRVGTLHVFPQAERLNGVPPKEEYLDFLDRHVTKRQDSDLAGATVFISRSRYRTDSMMGRVAGETYLDEVLKAAGVRVVHPELISVSEQVRLYQNAGRLLFSEGSAMHGLQLTGRIPAQVGVIVRRPKSRMAANAASRRASQLTWFETMDGHVRGIRKDLRGFDASNGIAVLDSGAFLDALATGFGLDLRAHWDAAAYREACLSDVKTWINHRRHRRRKQGLPAEDVEAVAGSIREVRLFEGALDHYPLV